MTSKSPARTREPISGNFSSTWKRAEVDTCGEERRRRKKAQEEEDRSEAAAAIRNYRRMADLCVPLVD
jgi:hypothetical protein